jgi:hypothetical protein
VIERVETTATVKTESMTDTQKADRHRYPQSARDALLWKRDGLGDYDSRRPLVPTATNLAGIVKHVASVEAGCFGDIVDRPFPEPFPWFDDDDDDDPNPDMWLTAEESVASDSPGLVPWWSEYRACLQVTAEPFG